MSLFNLLKGNNHRNKQTHKQTNKQTCIICSKSTPVLAKSKSWTISVERDKSRPLQQWYKWGAECLCVFSAFPQIEATLLRSAECEEVQRVAECCWHLAWRTSEPRRRLWQGHRGKHKWELMAPLFRVIRRALHHTIWGRHYWAQLTSCTYVHKGGRRYLKKRGKNRARPDIIKTQASVSPHNVMMGRNWCISCLELERAFHAGLHKHTSLYLAAC